MDDEAKTKAQLISEVQFLRQRIADLEARDAERQRVEQALHFHTHLLDAVEQAVIATDIEGKIIYWNPFAEMLYGWSATEAVGRNILEVTPAEISYTQAAEIMECLRAGEKWSGEFIVQRRDGTTFPALVTDTPIHDKQGQLIGVVGLSADITERKLIEAQLREQTETVETINRIGHLLSAELDLQQLMQRVTDAATELTGAQFGAFFYNIIDEHSERYTLYTLSGAPRDAFAHFPMPRNTSVFGPTFRGEEVIRLDNVREDPRYGHNPPYAGILPGHLPVTSYLAVPIISRSGEVLGGLFFGHAEARVFTERAERIVIGLARQTAIMMDNARLYHEAQQAIRTRDEFLSLAAHELKTPITSIIGYVQVLQRRIEREGTTSERNLRTLHTLSKQMVRLNQLINSLFDLSRIQTGQLALEHRLVDFPALVRRIIEETQPTLEHHTLEYSSSNSDEPLVVEGDAMRLEQVAQNLLHNAIKYSPNGGLVSVDVERQEKQVRFSVSDHGMGIPAEALPRLFSRFYRADNVQRSSISGIGMGLYVVKEIVMLHGGTIDVESTEGIGSSFHVYLPLHQYHQPVSGEKPNV